MEESFGRTTEPTTEADGMGGRDARPPDRDRHQREREPGRRTAGPSDPDVGARNADPLDARRPGRPNDDPLDPDGQVT